MKRKKLKQIAILSAIAVMATITNLPAAIEDTGLREEARA